MKLTLGHQKRLQIILWAPGRWGFGFARWPQSPPANWPQFGFWALLLGVIEFRYWPDFRGKG